MIAVGKTPPNRFVMGLAGVLALAGISARSQAQPVYQLNLLDESSVRIEGTSNKSDWTVDATTMTGTLWLSGETKEDAHPDSLRFTLPAADLKSGRSPIMDRLMYDALNTSEYPTIDYVLGPAGGVLASTMADTTTWNVAGLLTIAGATDTIATKVSGYPLEGDRLAFVGSLPLSMRDYGITPPTALFGALRTRDDVTVVFRLIFGDK